MWKNLCSTFQPSRAVVYWFHLIHPETILVVFPYRHVTLCHVMRHLYELPGKQNSMEPGQSHVAAIALSIQL